MFPGDVRDIGPGNSDVCEFTVIKTGELANGIAILPPGLNKADERNKHLFGSFLRIRPESDLI
jgi:hypothetical protein